MDIIDLSMPIGPHFRWTSGDAHQGRHRGRRSVPRLASRHHLPRLHHVDAQAHFVAHAPTIEATPLSRVVGPARVLDLRDVAPNTPIDAARLAQARSGRRGGRDPAAVRRVGREARQHHGGVLEGRAVADARCRRMAAARKPTAVAFDFPQDYPIRLLLDGVIAPTRGARHA